MDEEIQEGLATLFLWWYGNHPTIRSVLRDGFSSSSSRQYDTHRYRELPMLETEDTWRMRWFAKDKLTERVDCEIRQNFAWMIMDDERVHAVAMLIHTTTAPLWLKLAVIVLFDQVTRNVYRGTPLAYSGDAVSLPLALDLTEKELEQLPFHFQCTVWICLCNAEDAGVQAVLQRSIANMVKDSPHQGKQQCNLVAALQEIQKTTRNA